MRNTPFVLALCACAGAAHAQSLTWLHDVPDGAELGPGDSITITLSALMEEPTGAPFIALNATFFHTIADAGFQFGEVTSYEVLNDLDELSQNGPTSDGDNIFGISAGQLTVFGPFTSDNPIDVFSFTWEVVDPLLGGDVVYHTETQASLLWVGEDKESAESVEAVPIETQFGWTVVPSPAGAAVLLAGAPALARRRRSGGRSPLTGGRGSERRQRSYESQEIHGRQRALSTGQQAHTQKLSPEGRATPLGRTRRPARPGLPSPKCTWDSL